MSNLIAHKVSGSDDLLGPADYYFAHLTPLKRSLIINCPKCRQAQTPSPRTAAYEAISNLLLFITTLGRHGKSLHLDQMICRYCLHSFEVEEGNVHVSDEKAI